MDNAQKAIMIGVGLFITIIIISAVLLITNLGTDLVDNARSQLANISSSLQNQVLSSYDGKTMTGAEVLSAVQTYQNSEISVMIYTGNATFKTGKYAFTTTIADPTKPLAGGVKTTNTEYTDLGTAKTALASMQGTNGISGTQSYYTYVVRDQYTDSVMGLVFVRIGSATAANLELPTV